MSGDLLQTKLFVPRIRPSLVPRPRLIKMLNRGLQQECKLTLISAPAGFGKTTLVSEWVGDFRLDAAKESQDVNQIAWLSLDAGDNDPGRFLAYLIAALQTLALSTGSGQALSRVEGKVDGFGEGVLAALKSPQPPPTEVLLTSLLNEITTIPDKFILVLDDYHLIDAQAINNALTFLLEHMPPQMHLAIATREDPNLPLPRLRARGQLTELRAVDLRFSSTEAAEFLNQVMVLDLSAENIAALTTRTEGWIAGLQLAAVSMQGHKDAAALIKSFTGSHRFVLDYLIEEVLNQHSEDVQDFLLETAVLDRLTGSLCDALTGQDNGQATLEMLEHANLFIVPLDEERRWYRYHHLFADLLRRRLQQRSASSTGDEDWHAATLHSRASIWYENNGLGIQAFQHAAAVNDVERAEGLIEGEGLPLSFRGAVAPVLNWLASLPTTELDARPSLWVTYAMTLLTSGQMTAIEEKLQAAEGALEGIDPDDKTRDLIGRIADIRGTMAVGLRQTETIIAQSHRALAYLHPDNLTYRTSTTWKLGVAYEAQGDRAAALQAFTEAISISQASGNIYTQILATVGLGNIQLANNQLYLAAETYHHSLELVGDHPIPVSVHVHLCLARIFYQWNDLDAAQLHGQKSLQHSQPYKDQYDIYVASQLFLARLKLAQGDVVGAATILAEAERSIHQHNFVYQIPVATAVQVLVLLQQGKLKRAFTLTQTHKIPISQARVYLAQGDTSAALALLEPLRRQVQAKCWYDEQLKVMVLQAVVLHIHGEETKALQLLDEALALAEPGGFIRIFIDEGAPMAWLLTKTLSHTTFPDYVRQLLTTFPTTELRKIDAAKSQTPESEWVEPLSEREIEVLQLIAEGLTNPEIANRLYISLNTVKVHTRNINSKLDAHTRTEAVAKARDLSILPT